MRLSPVTVGIFNTIAILTSLARPAAAQEKEAVVGRYEFALSAGAFDTAASDPSIEAGFELRRLSLWRGLGFVGGVSATEDASVWVYGGARYDFSVGQRWAITPGFAVGLYEQGDGKDLGQTLEFRSSIEVARRVSARLRVGLVFYHLSNASMSEVNPGSNSLVLCFAFRPPDRA